MAAYRPVGRNADGRLEVFSDGKGQNGTELWHSWQTAPMGGWSAWESLGTHPPEFIGFVAASANADGRLEVFARIGLMSSGTIWHIWQTAPNGGGARGTISARRPLASRRTFSPSARTLMGGWKFSW